MFWLEIFGSFWAFFSDKFAHQLTRNNPYLFDTRRQVGGEEDNYVMAAFRMYLNVLNVGCAL